MKQIIALQEYTDKYVSFYEGEIRNIEDGIANKLIEEGIVAEHDESSNSNTTESSSFFINCTKINNTYTSDKTYQEVQQALNENQVLIISFSKEWYYYQGNMNDVLIFIHIHGYYDSWDGEWILPRINYFQLNRDNKLEFYYITLGT